MRRIGMPLALSLPLTALFLVPATADVPVADDEPLPVKQPVRRPPVQPGGGPVPPGTVLSDEEALKKAGLEPTDAAKLLDYLRSRTVTDATRARIEDVIKKFANDDFDDRVAAVEEIEQYGPAAITLLKEAERGDDPEIAYRARQALKRMELVPHAQVAAAAVRAVVKLKPKDAAAVLLGYLPMADTDEVDEMIRAGLVTLAVANGKAEPALVKALEDKTPARRAAAYVALIEGGPPGERIRIKDAYPLVKAAVLKETDIDAKFRGLWTMLLTCREKEFLPELIAMIPDLPRGRIWQLEEFLLLLAGKDKPKDATFGSTADSLVKARDAWAAWWKKASTGADLAKFDFKPRVTGYTDIIEYDYRTYAYARVITLGPDMKEKGRLGGGGPNNGEQITFLGDMKRLPNGNYILAEINNSRLTERDSTGRLIKNTSVVQPVSVDVLPDGGLIVVSRNQVVRFDKTMKQVWIFQRQQYDILGGRLLPNGDVVFVTQFQGGNLTSKCYRIRATEKDGKWEVKEIGRDGKPLGKDNEALTIGNLHQQQSIDVTADEKVVICEYNRVAEYDLKTGKEVWTYNANNATSCQRLPNGNTLVTLFNTGPGGKVVEVDPSGDVVWEYESKDGFRAARAYRR